MHTGADVHCAHVSSACPPSLQRSAIGSNAWVEASGHGVEGGRGFGRGVWNISVIHAVSHPSTRPPRPPFLSPLVAPTPTAPAVPPLPSHGYSPSNIQSFSGTHSGTLFRRRAWAGGRRPSCAAATRPSARPLPALARSPSPSAASSSCTASGTGVGGRAASGKRGGEAPSQDQSLSWVQLVSRGGRK